MSSIPSVSQYLLHTHRQPIWLIATASPVKSQRRRNIIRATWQNLYRDPAFTMRFFISDPTETWMPLILHENATYGDLIMLDNLEENHHIANTIKSLEFFRYIAASGSTWQFVSKVDDDSFIDAKTFYREFILPRLYQITSHFGHGSDEGKINRTIIGRSLVHSEPRYGYAGGQFYTLSWDMVLLVVRLFTENPITDEHEDVLLGRLLHEAGEAFDLVILDSSRAFDYDERNQDKGAWAHNVTRDAINPHKMKDDGEYLKVAAMFDATGVIDSVA